MHIPDKLRVLTIWFQEAMKKTQQQEIQHEKRQVQTEDDAALKKIQDRLKRV